MVNNDTIHLTLYCDESTKVRLADDVLGGPPAYWDYVGMLLVPAERSDALLQMILDARCLNPDNKTWDSCPVHCRFHSDNNTKVHYTEADDTRKYRVACSWLDLLLDHNKSDLGLIYFYILGIDRSKLDIDRFGPSNQQNRNITVYNRFFRTAILRSAKSFFSRYPNIVVDAIYHDRGAGQDHPLFPWHSIWRIGQDDDKLTFGDLQVRFIDSDHRKPEGDPVHSHFVQFIDLILGCTVNNLHYKARSKNKTALTLRAKPLVERIITKPKNKNSRYHYFRRQSIEFFPKHSLASLDETSLEFKMKQQNNFYTKRELRIERRHQPTLFSSGA